MPYFSIEDLPLTVRKHIPKKAQEIFRKAFNQAWDTYKNPKNLPAGVDRIEIATKIAWAAVKEEYSKGKMRGKPNVSTSTTNFHDVSHGDARPEYGKKLRESVKKTKPGVQQKTLKSKSKQSSKIVKQKK